MTTRVDTRIFTGKKAFSVNNKNTGSVDWSSPLEFGLRSVRAHEVGVRSDYTLIESNRSGAQFAVPTTAWKKAEKAHH